MRYTVPMLTSVFLLVAFGAGFMLAHRARVWSVVSRLAQRVHVALELLGHRIRVVLRRTLSSVPSPSDISPLGAPAGEMGLELRRDPPSAASPSNDALAPVPKLDAISSIGFDPIAPRGTSTTDLALHSEEWKTAMAAIGERFSSANVTAIVFVHGTFAGTDPFSAYTFVERVLPSIGPQLARTLRKKTRGYIGRVLGDLGNFGAEYVRLFEEAIRPCGARIPCTEFVWSSENHHVGRLEGALSLVRTLATHAELGYQTRSTWEASSKPRLLVLGHSHAGQLFALITQLLARSIGAEAIFDVARARGLDLAALEADVATLASCDLDFVAFGSPARYAWATVAGVRALHVIAVPAEGSRAGTGDLVRRIAVEGSDFPPLSLEDRRINAALGESLGAPGFAPSRVAMALRDGVAPPRYGDVAFVEYPDRGFVSSGLGHGSYTRLDAMLFNARLVADRLYPELASTPAQSPLPVTRAAWARIRWLLDPRGV